MVEMNTTTASETTVAAVSPTPAAVDTALPVRTSRPSPEKLSGFRPIWVPSPKKLWAWFARARASSRSVGKASANSRDCISTAGTSARPRSQNTPPIAAMTVYAVLPEATGLSTPTPSAVPMAGVYLLTAGWGRIDLSLLAVAGLSGLAVFGDDELGQFLDGALGDRLVVLYAAVSEQVDPVADVEDLGVVVDDQDHRYAPFIFEALDEVQDQGSLLRTHRRERLVKEQHLCVRVD